MTYQEFRTKHQQLYDRITFDDLRQDTPEVRQAITTLWRFQDANPEHFKKLLTEESF